MGTSSIELSKLLHDIASKQQGFFTAKQATAAGYADSVHNYHVQNGDWVKACRGIYRLAAFPESHWPELVIWSLWSRGREYKPLGVFSHDTALAIHGKLDEKTSALHMTVPTTFRKNCEIPPHLVLHKEDLAESEIEERDGYSVTTLERTLRDTETAHIVEMPKGPRGPVSVARSAPLRLGKRSPADLNLRDVLVVVKPFDAVEIKAVSITSAWSGGKSFEEALMAGED
jgi:hypothetical protein